MADALMQVRIRTDDPEEAHEWLRHAYGDHTFRLSGRRDAFVFSHEVADCGPVRTGVGRHTMELRGTWQPMEDTLLFVHLLSGRCSARGRTGGVDALPGDVFGVDPDSPAEITWDDMTVAQVRVRRATAERIAAETAGDDRDGTAVAWELGRPALPARAAHWRSLMRYVNGELATNIAVRSSPLVMRQVQRLIVTTALQTFPNSTLGGAPGRPGSASSAALRRALAYVDEHAGDDIDLADIADAAHLGPRALQRAFRSALDRTPLQHLRSVRLDRAHEELLAADPTDGTTVHAVALRWGFGHPGRFAADYRVRFDRSPSDTLRG